MTDDTRRAGGCACGAVRFTTLGPPRRGGLCHCRTCRKAHAAAFYPFVVFAGNQVEMRGDVAAWASSDSYLRFFCPRCGSRTHAQNTGADGATEIELSLAASTRSDGSHRSMKAGWRGANPG